MLRKRLFISTLFAFVLSLTTLPSSAAISQEFDKIYSLQSGGSFELQNVNGPVEVPGFENWNCGCSAESGKTPKVSRSN